MENYEKLARMISKAGKVIAKESCAKEYFLESNHSDTIFVTSDSGFEAIVIGDVYGKVNGYMYLYYNNTPKRNSYPPVKVIAEQLEKIANEEALETGEGKAAYFDLKEYGNLEKQKKYFADIVKRMATIR